MRWRYWRMMFFLSNFRLMYIFCIVIFVRCCVTAVLVFKLLSIHRVSRTLSAKRFFILADVFVLLMPPSLPFLDYSVPSSILENPMLLIICRERMYVYWKKTKRLTLSWNLKYWKVKSRSSCVGLSHSDRFYFLGTNEVTHRSVLNIVSSDLTVTYSCFRPTGSP